MITGIHHVQVCAPAGSEAEARAFYGGLLGLPEIEKPPGLKQRGGVWFELGAQQLHVGIEADFRPARRAHPALVVAGLAALRARLEAAGVTTETDELFPGYHRYYVRDPFGNRIELLEPISAQ